MKSTKFFAVSCFIAASVASGGIAASAPAHADDPDAISLTVTDDSLVATDSDGNAVSVIKDTKTDGLRIIQAATDDGVPVLVTEYFAPPVAPSDEALQPDVKNGNDPSNYKVNSDFGAAADASSTSSPNDQSTQLDPSTMDPTFATAVTPTTVTVAWPSDTDDPSPAPSSSSPSASAMRAAAPAADSNHQKSYTHLKANSSHTYTIKTLDAGGRTVTRTIPVRTLAVPKKGMRPFSLPGDGGGSQGAMQSMAFLHKAFIPDNLVDMDALVAFGCGKFGQSDYQFKGDDRSWKTPTSADPSSSTDFRTLMYAKVKWTSGSAEVSTLRRVDPTRMYYKGKPYESRTASMDKMLFQDIERGQSYAQVRFNHQSGNPFCAAGAITYNEIVRYYRNGTLEVVGSRYPVPRHEGYGQWDRVGTDPTWHTEFHLDNKGFGCLTGQCGRDTINFSKQY